MHASMHLFQRKYALNMQNSAREINANSPGSIQFPYIRAYPSCYLTYSTVIFIRNRLRRALVLDPSVGRIVAMRIHIKSYIIATVTRKKRTLRRCENDTIAVNGDAAFFAAPKFQCG